MIIMKVIRTLNAVIVGSSKLSGNSIIIIIAEYNGHENH